MIRRLVSTSSSTLCKQVTKTTSTKQAYIYSNLKFLSDTPKTNGEQQQETATPAEQAPVDELTKQKEINKKLEEEIHNLKEKVLRAYANEENVRRIAKNDVENARQYANAKFAKSILEVADNLDRAMQTTEQEISNSPPEVQAPLNVLLTGLHMTRNELEKAFKQHGISKYGQVGEPFKPELHDALFRIPDKTKENGAIGQILKHGYKLHDRVIRAAEVGTICHPEE